MKEIEIELNITTSGSGENRDGLTREKIYVALVTKDFITNENCMGEMRDAKSMKLNMFAIMKKGIKIPKIIHEMPWKRVIMFQDESQIPVVAELLKLEIGKLEMKNDKRR